MTEFPDDRTRAPLERPASDASLQAWGAPLFAFLVALTLLKGIRMPNRWAVTHYLFTYRMGFIKRGLWGELLSLVLGSWTARYFPLAIIGLLVLACVIALAVRLCRALPSGPARVPMLIVVCSSPALAFFAHLAGYLEQIGYLVLLTIVLSRGSWRLRVALALGAAAVLPLVHEASILWVGPLTCLAVVVGASGQPRAASRRLAAATLVACVWMVSTLAVIEFGGTSAARADALRDDRNAYFEIRPRQDAFHALSMSLGASLDDMRVRWSDRDVQIEMAFSVLVFAPATIFLGVMAGRATRSLDPGAWVRGTAMALSGLAIAGPLLLHFVGWDRHRWNALACLNAGLAALILYGVPAGAPALAKRASPTRTLAVALAICLWGVSADVVLFDEYVTNHPPFTQQIRFLIDAVTSPDRTRWIPSPGR